MPNPTNSLWSMTSGVMQLTRPLGQIHISFKVEFTHRVELSCTFKDGDVFWLWLSWLAVYIAVSLKSLTWGEGLNFFYFFVTHKFCCVPPYMNNKWICNESRANEWEISSSKTTVSVKKKKKKKIVLRKSWEEFQEPIRQTSYKTPVK